MATRDQVLFWSTLDYDVHDAPLGILNHVPGDANDPTFQEHAWELTRDHLKILLRNVKRKIYRIGGVVQCRVGKG